LSAGDGASDKFSDSYFAVLATYIPSQGPPEKEARKPVPKFASRIIFMGKSAKKSFIIRNEFRK